MKTFVKTFRLSLETLSLSRKKRWVFHKRKNWVNLKLSQINLVFLYFEHYAKGTHFRHLFRVMYNSPITYDAFVIVINVAFNAITRKLDLFTQLYTFDKSAYIWSSSIIHIISAILKINSKSPKICSIHTVLDKIASKIPKK